MIPYFFIPATKFQKVTTIRKLGVIHIILDLEDAIAGNDLNVWLDRVIANYSSLSECYLRLPLHSMDGQLDLNNLKRVIDIGFQRFILPKVANIVELDKVLTTIHSFPKNDAFECVLLIEHPRLWTELTTQLPRWVDQLSGLAMGSHDLMLQLGAIHNATNLFHLRQQLLIWAKAYELQAIDIASMELTNQEVFRVEVIEGFQLGYTAKFILHPWQLTQLRAIPFYTTDDLAWAQAVEVEWRKVGNRQAFEPIIIDGEIVERPHLAKMERILNYFSSAG